MSNELEQEEELVYEEATTTTEYIGASYNALQSISDMDTALMSKEDAKRVHRIKRRSLRIIDHCLGILYDELFDEETDKE